VVFGGSQFQRQGAEVVGRHEAALLGRMQGRERRAALRLEPLADLAWHVLPSVQVHGTFVDQVNQLAEPTQVGVVDGQSALPGGEQTKQGR